MKNEGMKELIMRVGFKEMGYRFKSLLKGALKWALYFVLIIMLALTIRVFFFELYKIPSSSMEPTLVPGDFIVVSKMSYGARLLKFKKFFKESKIEYIRTWGWGRIKKGDVFVFNWPSYYTLNDSFPNMYGSCIVKRCFGMPGDTVIIKNEKINNEGINNEGINNERMKNEGMKNEGIKNYNIAEGKPDLFPHDSTLNWTLDHYGPLLVPGKGITMELTPIAAKHYKDVLLYEGYGTRTCNDSVFLNGNYTKTITFKNNYYFMKGDNFYGSQDSRFWGFVPEDNIIGKAKLVVGSLNQGYSGLKKIVWRRFLKFIN